MHLLLFIDNYYIFVKTLYTLIMRKLQILKALLDLFWFVSIIGLIGLIIFLPFLLFDGDDITVKIKGQEIISNDIFSKIIIIASAIGGLLFIYSIYLLRIVISYFHQRDIFNIEVIRNFNLIGKLIIFSSLISNSALFIFNMVKRNNIGLSLDIGSYDSFILSICLGLFFMVISEVFKIAKNMKEENELTI